MKFYELTYLISPDVSETEVRTIQEKISSLIQDQGGILAQVKEPMKKRLTYPIKKKDQAYLATLDFQINPENLVEIEKKIKSENQILRYLVLTKPRPKEILARGKKIPSLKPVKRIIKPKVELTEIEKKLEEILGE